MATSKTVTVLIGEDGTLEFDMAGYKGKECQGEIKDLISQLGNEKKTTKKVEYYKDNKIHIEQRF
jgi:hypothetical protein